MKNLVAILIGLTMTIVAVYTGLAEQLLLFIIIGQVPYTNSSLEPTVMIIFWLSLAPAIFIAKRLLSAELWQAMEVIGKANQRRLNIRHRRSARNAQYTQLLTVALLDAASRIPESSASDPELYLRRRFVALPA